MKELSREEILSLIQREIGKTKEIIAEYKESTAPVEPDCAIGRVSRMDAINNKTIVEAALRTAEEKLNKLRLMEENIDSPDFGTCARCGVKIPAGRLILKPESPYCVRCA